MAEISIDSFEKPDMPANLRPVGRIPMDPPSAPEVRLPKGSCDAHVHFFAGPDDHPRLADRLEDPAPGSTGEWFGRLQRQLAALGLARVVLVQSVVYGQDNAAMLEGLEALGPETARGIALVEPDATVAELRRLRQSGVRGIRLNFRHRGPLDLEALEAMAPRLDDAGLHVQILFASWDQAHDYAARIDGLPVDVVADHLVGPDLDRMEGPFLDLVRRGRVYIKVSAAYRVCAAPHHRLRQALDLLVDDRPDRLVWGSDWPFVMHDGPAPDTGKSLDALFGALDEATLAAIFVDNPKRLYGFGQ